MTSHPYLKREKSLYPCEEILTIEHLLLSDEIKIKNYYVFSHDILLLCPVFFPYNFILCFPLYLSSPIWWQAMQDEYDTFVANNTWTPTLLPLSLTSIDVKENVDGTINNYKARLVGKGCH
ncbi:hypothetical protein V8G54_019867 [Vigna mungo]|uniref:Uncharacterized protein n=1 Tax=Vigna mungo TaxID=3915 RepID=A0AAQ3NBK3_VIGMU